MTTESERFNIGAPSHEDVGTQQLIDRLIGQLDRIGHGRRPDPPGVKNAPMTAPLKMGHGLAPMSRVYDFDIPAPDSTYVLF